MLLQLLTLANDFLWNRLVLWFLLSAGLFFTIYLGFVQIRFFRQSIEAQKNASELLEKKFQEAVRKAKETPDTGKPIRDFDLD